ncbi:plasmid stabilization protein [Aminobacter anthyllidis]|uniref:Plasmid stabilization protein n=1 Tax=Aminobacter anthyllidis TaxID=1035067 RepID=A0A9X1AE58_9HYPH|nr:plasmid stabilization protein [Aminobacter anthyllidis]MBT1158244.1 plasmid stabilization protein [Aminobacter anthyllidis]MDH4986495.1 plasmid stabilization protein [Aminobacter anthyllidis]
MATLTIRNVPEDVKQALRVKAAQNGNSLEEALRQILSGEVAAEQTLASRIGADEIMRRAAELESDQPTDNRYKHFSQKELSDLICGEFDGL